MSNHSRSFIPYGRQTVTEADIHAVVEVLRSSYLTQGPVIPAFEEAVSSKVSAKYGVAVNSATSGLHIACLALGLGAGDYLWTSPITFVASANCGLYCGATVDFVDIDPTTGLMSIDALSAKLEQAEISGTLPKVVVPVHLTGSSCDMAAISLLAERYGFAVIEDASHAIGGQYHGEPVGNCRYSDITVFSFHPVKIITTGEGGLNTTNNPVLAQCMTELRSHGIVREAEQFKYPPAGPWVYEQQQLGFNYRITDLQAALGLSQLQRLDEIVAERNSHLHHYQVLLADLRVHLLEVPKDVRSSVHLAVIRLVDSRPEHHRCIFEGLRNAGIGVQLHYSPVHLQPYYRNLGFKPNDFPEAEAYGRNAISLPLYPGLKNHEKEFIVNLLADLLDRRR
ncbi:UDP-4-amino-4,6-dideoxy-N-acetyl-beta-L-altrosamine transaminase [Synechococcus sp. HK01-R]|uniref:UDP-4-amino-4, 6-dideoxy-N-acetyl-beta-L-altrosamine transaminase n=1 Tax=Synechococcus sp. HK01-R TaxID=2751171 RepID=UPI0016290AFD|nr:UDP-4-amino-4,6-dideoxy-N-acetyl-beta-L-altrosamine transaminase [Synechococcus sp. HK01-R]QNG27874.1 UDP-4-amino-4,6-dideoxy-N-acetyl-beta-L-altrosamine transaminase [Synechococcus sp. HK01-R]